MTNKFQFMKYWYVAILFFLIVQNSTFGQRIVVETWDSGKEKVVFDITKGTYEKPIDYYYFKFYPNGKVYKEGNYVNEKVSGEWKFYYQNGKLKSSAVYAFGNLSGEYKSYYISGDIEQMGQYQVGQLVDVQLFNRDGTIKDKAEEDVSYLVKDSVKAWERSQIETAWVDCFMRMDEVFPNAEEYCTCMIDSAAKFVEYEEFYYLSEYQRSVLFRYMMEYKGFCRGIIENPIEKNPE